MMNHTIYRPCAYQKNNFALCCCPHNTDIIDRKIAANPFYHVWSQLAEPMAVLILIADQINPTTRR